MSNPYDPSEFPIPYNSELRISNITSFSPFNFSERMNFYMNNLQCNDSLCNISMLNNSYKAIILNISLDVSSSTDYLAVRFNFVFPDMNVKIPPCMRFNMYPFNKGQLVIFKFSTIIRRKHSSLLAKLFGFEPNLEEVFIDIETKELQQTLNSSYSTLVLQPKENITYYEDYISHHSIGSIVSGAGGLYGALIRIYILLFGSTKLSPWGIVQKYTCCWNLREDYMHRLMKWYISKAGIPLVENPSNLPPKATVENRIATLETLLREFFLDDKNDSLQDDIIVSVNKNAPL
ncbi:35769_t:CDS:2 [Gigaspora margarita]|uniref:35769_t:CDS:1 n=1 Tax=Gigaspora margarita TaxID=4874 RepID=A0ABN7UBU5_GIGMA|nr:35769_t:CDS:2 [Gigaspora margarita]